MIPSCDIIAAKTTVPAICRASGVSICEFVRVKQVTEYLQKGDVDLLAGCGAGDVSVANRCQGRHLNG